jgi:hypothetical protein
MAQNLPVTLYAPPEHYVRAANNLEQSIRERLKPFQVRLIWARIIATIITLIMGFLAFAIMVSIFELPFIMAILLAVVVQVMAVVAFHVWFYELHQGERHSPLKKWAGFSFAIALSLFMLGIGGYRAYMYLSELGMLPLLLGLCVFIFALIEPTASCLAGFCTAAAEHALDFPSNMMERAHEHRKVVITTPDSETWKMSMTQADEEREAISQERTDTSVEMKWRDRRLKHLDDWIRQLEAYNPGRRATRVVGEEGEVPTIRSNSSPSLKIAE